MKPCVFCPNPRTTKRGEHVWDDWLNREDGKSLNIPSRVGILGKDGVLIREYGARQINATKPVVCDPCNHGWMSDLTTEWKHTLEGCIRYERPVTLLPLGIITLTAYAFMKAAVLDYSADDVRPPFIPPSACHRFRDACLGNRDFVLPDGLQVWIAHYRAVHKREYLYMLDAMPITFGPFRGYDVMLLVYVCGAFVFHLSFLRWRKNKRRPIGTPLFTQPRIWDNVSIPVWPEMTPTTWPPRNHLSGSTLEDFRKRLRNLRVPRP